MLRILYTGALSDGEPQTDGRRSLGGFISSTDVESDRLGAVFGSISRDPTVGNKNNYYCFAIHNTSDSSLRVLIDATVLPTDNGVFRANTRDLGVVSVVSLAIEPAARRKVIGIKTESPLSFSSVSSSYSSPPLPFSEHAADNQLETAMLPNGYVGLWVRRAVMTKALASNYNEEALFFEHISNDTRPEPSDKGELDSRFADGFPTSLEENIRIDINYEPAST